jgi:hypothetical protein
MVRALLLTVLFCTAVSANDIYVEQAQEEPEGTKVALETESTEKDLISPTSTEQYCSVVAGCYVKE